MLTTIAHAVRIIAGGVRSLFQELYRTPPAC
jgi:hypothetical protein